ncbi:MAG: ABC transporter permease [Thalassobaculum sp.]|uniref:ABC transporter permease n=1 Tax=Thalassobaculum sp. TaxID=2022740 RepID=UPI0032EC6877
MMRVHRFARPLAIAAGLVALWQAVVWATAAPPYILPGPGRVLVAWVERSDIILKHAGTTATEILLGLLLGAAVGLAVATTLHAVRPIRPWLLPVLVVSQAIPVFALAPLLVLWLGYGMASKVVMAGLIIFFPVAAAFYDGLRRVEPLWLDAARTLGCRGPRLFRRVRLPAALPALASGLRVATAVAPIGAVVGEWVGSSAGLGYLMLHANGRMQTDLMFAALLTLAILSVALYTAVDAGLRRAMPWQAGEAEEPH